MENNYLSHDAGGKGPCMIAKNHAIMPVICVDNSVVHMIASIMESLSQSSQSHNPAIIMVESADLS